jgi:hypothetical protein
MGKWYLADGAERFGQTKVYKQIDPVHATVHDAMKKNLVYVQEESTLKYDHPKIIVENFLEMENASEKLYSLLDEMLVEYNSKNY